MLYVKELQTYSLEELNDIGLVKSEINELMGRNIIKRIKKEQYSFKFVGIMVVNSKVIFSVPKYIETNNNRNIMSSILKLFMVYCKYENLTEDELEGFGNESKENNFIALMVHILNFYFENGLYLNDHKVSVLNGESEIDWDKTLECLDPIFINNQPVYLEYYTTENEEEKNNYFKNLNKYIINQCMDILNEYEVLEALGFEYMKFEYDESIIDNENLIEVENKLLMELNTQFITDKQEILKSMLAFIKKEYTINNEDSIIFYGTGSFHIVWEKVCSFVFANKYYDLKEKIDKPIWKIFNINEFSKNTWIPDIIYEDSNLFAVLDAKYYSLKITPSSLDNNPGIEDIAKQYFYGQAFEKYRGNKRFENILLFPKEISDVEYFGEVSIKFLITENIKGIRLINLPTSVMYNLYCERRQRNLEKFIIDKIQNK